MSITCYLAPDPIQSTFFIPGGNTPANGGQLFFYSSGTSTKTTVYKDNLGATAWSNPIVLDSGGNLPSGGEVWIPSGVTVKVVFAPSNDTDPPSSPYWSKDNLAGVNDIAFPSASVGFITGRLTAQSGSAVPTSDISTTRIFYTPYNGNIINIYNGSGSWNQYVYSEIGMTLPTSTAVYDVFVTVSSGTPLLTTKAWVSDLVRSTGALTLQNGILVNAQDLTQLYLGTLYASSGVVLDQAAFRYLYNYYNQIDRPMQVKPSTSVWTYSTGTIRQANNDPAMALNFVVGQVTQVNAFINQVGQATSPARFEMANAIGVNTVTSFTTSGANDFFSVSTGANDFTPIHAMYLGYPAQGRNSFNWLEAVGNAVTSVKFGDQGSILLRVGMYGSFRG